MSEERTDYKTCLHNPVQSCDTITVADHIIVTRAELEHERRHLLGRLQQLHKLLGYPPLLTGKEQRRDQARRDVR